MALTKATNSMIKGAPVNVLDYGAVGDGVTDDAPAIRLALAASGNIVFPSGSYLIGSQITYSVSNTTVDFGDATIIHADYTGAAFQFGAGNDTFSHTGLTITGGFFTQSNIVSSLYKPYITIGAFKDFSVTGCNMKNVSNGGLTVLHGAEDGVIDNIKIKDADGHANPRGIWLEGSGATGYQSFYYNVNTMSTTPDFAFPIYGITNVSITNCIIDMPSRGIYLMNARNTTITNCIMNLPLTGAARCVSVNTYSPNTIISNCTFTGNGAGIGVLATQFSPVIVNSCFFKGNFGSGQDMHLQYGAKVTVTNCTFTTSTVRQILIDMGAEVILKSNLFERATYSAGYRVVDAKVIIPTGEFSAGEIAAGIGNNGVIVGSLVAQDNIVKNGTFINIDTAANPSQDTLNFPAFGQVVAKGNLFYGADLYAGSDRPVVCTTPSPAVGQTTIVDYIDNQVYPSTAGTTNAVNQIGLSGVTRFSQIYTTATQVSTDGAGAVSELKVSGAPISLSPIFSGTNILLRPRGDGGGVPTVLSVTDDGGTVAAVEYKLTRVVNDWLLQLYDGAGVLIDATTTDVAVFVVSGGQGNP